MSDYAVVLDSMGARYQKAAFHWQVGETGMAPGWILDLSVVVSQARELFSLVLPFLLAESVPFCIPRDEDTCDLILSGSLGLEQIGKVCSIGPTGAERALCLGKELLRRTQGLKGPAVLTDIHLGGIVYTRYGSPASPDYTIPFQLPGGQAWPFAELAPPQGPPAKRSLQGVYRPTEVLKTDPKGNVYRGLWVKSLFRIQKVIIKEGLQHMGSDMHGRDIYDRLQWQERIWQELHMHVPMPAVTAFFQEAGASYLVMENIEGVSLMEWLGQINAAGGAWMDLPKGIADACVGYLQSITAILGRMHEQGYVHRDVAPGNFIIDRRGRLYLIDLELVYNIERGKPDPPFGIGSAGFMSPEQQRVERPSVKEDMYGLGGLMAMVFTGLTPVKFGTGDPEKLRRALDYFSGDGEVSKMIARCLDRDPGMRPGLATIADALEECRGRINGFVDGDRARKIVLPSEEAIQKTVTGAIAGINQEPTVLQDGLWYSAFKRAKGSAGPVNREYAKYPGLYEGVAGVLYVLARAKNAGFDVSASEEGIRKGLVFVREALQDAEMGAGLYHGRAGVALALAECYRAGICEDREEVMQRIQDCLGTVAEGLDLGEGIAGQGIALLGCRDILPGDFVRAVGGRIVERLLAGQGKDGSWTLGQGSDKKRSSLRMDNGVAGVIWFLLAYYKTYPGPRLGDALKKGLRWIMKQKVGQHEQRDVVLVFIRAYEVLPDPVWKEAAEKMLGGFAARPVHTDFSQAVGLAGLGELLLEAARVFENPEWGSRAQWIAGVFVHTACVGEQGGLYWQMQENERPTADLMTGTGGVIHFLLRCLDPGKMPIRIWS